MQSVSPLVSMVTDYVDQSIVVTNLKLYNWLNIVWLKKKDVILLKSKKKQLLKLPFS